MPRTHSHGSRWIVGNDTYSGVRTSQNGGSGGISPAFFCAWRRAPRSTTRARGSEAHRTRERVPRHPAVVHHAVGNRGVVLGEQRPEVLALARPRDVVPQHTRPVARDQLAQVRGGVVGVVAARDRRDHVGHRAERTILERPVEPARVVDAEAQALRAHGLAELADDVTRAVPTRPARVRDVRRPQAVPVVVLGHEHHVARPGRRERARPLVGVPRREPGLPLGRELAVGLVAVGGAVMLGHGTVREPQRVLVPLRVRRPAHRTRVARLHHRGDVVGHGREPGHRCRSPVHEDAELGVAPPGGDLVATQRLQDGIAVGHRRDGSAEIRRPGAAVRLDGPGTGPRPGARVSPKPKPKSPRRSRRRDRPASRRPRPRAPAARPAPAAKPRLPIGWVVAGGVVAVARDRARRGPRQRRRELLAGRRRRDARLGRARPQHDGGRRAAARRRRGSPPTPTPRSRST